MKDDLQALIQQALNALQDQGLISLPDNLKIQIQNTRDPAHGDFACNIAMMLAKPAKMAPKLLAEKLINALPSSDFLAGAEVAGPGFINFRIQQASLNDVVKTILGEGEQFGLAKESKNKKIHMEYVSANPTGPLHVGHGRGAAYGTCVANILTANGYDVHREYYVNDAGRQMRILAMSVYLRYLQRQGEVIEFPEGAYHGEYIIDIANSIIEQYSGRFHHTAESLERLMPIDLVLEEKASEDQAKAIRESILDAYVDAVQKLLSADNFAIIFKFTMEVVLGDIKEDLHEFGVDYDNWFHESSLFTKGLINAGVDLLKTHGYVYEKESALWFRATELGDEKDRVLIRANGQPTYFASDVAYHFYKYKEGYDNIIDVFGADHHGYMARLRCFLKGLGEDPEKLKILLVQFAILYRGKEKVSMSTRSGQFVTLRELRQEVGNDAARFFYVMRKPDQHLDFDMELAKSKSNENPVYYIQYAHARICSVWRQLDASEWQWGQENGLANLELLSNQHEKDIITAIARYPELIKTVGEQYAPHQIAHYLQHLANCFHSYYNAEKFLVEQKELRNARLCLIAAVRQIFVSGLKLLGVSAPQEM